MVGIRSRARVRRKRFSGSNFGAAVGVLLLAGPVRAETTFELIEPPWRGLAGSSQDTSVIVATDCYELADGSTRCTVPARWERGELTHVFAPPDGLTWSQVGGISADGSAVAGAYYRFDYATSGRLVWGEAFVFRDGVEQPLPPLPEDGIPIRATISRNGSVVTVFGSKGPPAYEPIAIQIRENRVEVIEGMYAGYVSGDGSTILSYSRIAEGQSEYAIWREGRRTRLEPQPRIGYEFVNGISLYGDILVGEPAFQIRDGRWMDLELPPEVGEAAAHLVNADGTLITGYVQGWADGPPEEVRTTILWNEAGVPTYLESRLEEAGIDLGEWLLLGVDWMSDDGRILIGGAYLPDTARTAYFRVRFSEPQSVEIAVQPHSRHARIRVARRYVRVALFGSSDLDVRHVDASTLALGPGEAPPIETSGRRGRRRHRDWDLDGFDDLLLRFSVDAAGLPHGVSEACLAGRTSDGVEFRGCDFVERTRSTRTREAGRAGR